MRRCYATLLALCLGFSSSPTRTRHRFLSRRPPTHLPHNAICQPSIESIASGQFFLISQIRAFSPHSNIHGSAWKHRREGSSRLPSQWHSCDLSGDLTFRQTIAISRIPLGVYLASYDYRLVRHFTCWSLQMLSAWSKPTNGASAYGLTRVVIDRFVAGLHAICIMPYTSRRQ